MKFHESTHVLDGKNRGMHNQVDNGVLDYDMLGDGDNQKGSFQRESFNFILHSNTLAAAGGPGSQAKRFAGKGAGRQRG